MSSIRILFPRGTLLDSLRRCASLALARGALSPIEASVASIEDAGMVFVVRQASTLKRKAAARSRSASIDPFLPYDPALLVAEVSRSHVALLNKFAVLDGHLLLVTRSYEDQERLIGADDWIALAACLREFESFGFYNGGAGGGASQAHKHLQVVPLASLARDGRLPVEALLAPLRGASGVLRVKGLRFCHAFAWLDRHLFEDIGAASSALEQSYRQLFGEVGLRGVSGPDGERQSQAYNLLLTREWMLVVPRSSEACGGVSVNGLGYAGSLFVPDAAGMDAVRRIGPMNLLAGVGQPPMWKTNPLARDAAME